MLVAMSVEAPGDQAATTCMLLTVGIDSGASFGIQHALENPGRALNFGMGRLNVPLARGEVTVAPDYWLRQFLAVLGAADDVLADLRTHPETLQERITARTFIDGMRQWAHHCALVRSGGDARLPINVPDDVATMALNLHRSGIRLRLASEEAMSHGQATSPAAEPSSPLERAHATDFTWIVVGGERYEFKKGQQAAAVGVLWGEWERSGYRDGSGVASDVIHEQIGSGATRLRMDQLFRGASAWKQVIRKTPQGTFAIYGSDSRPIPKE